MPVSVVDMSLCLGSWGQKMQRKGKVLDCWQFLRCNARNSFPPQCVGRQGRCFLCRCSERRRLFKILKFDFSDFSTFFCLCFPRFLRGTLVDEPPVKDWCLPGTVCHQSHPQSSGRIGVAGKPQTNHPGIGAEHLAFKHVPDLGYLGSWLLANPAACASKVTCSHKCNADR